VRVGVQRHAPAALTSGKTRYPLYGRLGGPRGWSGSVRNISPPRGFDPRTVEAAAGRYIDWAIPAHQLRHVGTIVVLKQTGKQQTEHGGKRTVDVKIHVKRGPNYLNSETFKLSKQNVTEKRLLVSQCLPVGTKINFEVLIICVKFHITEIRQNF
jgi:hypothetical protein